MSKADVLVELANRVRNRTPIITADELAKWPSGMIEELESAGILRGIDLAKTVGCDACGEDHVEQVQFLQSPPGSVLRAYIACPETGRVQIPLHRLQQWVINEAQLPANDLPRKPSRDRVHPASGIADPPISERAQLVLIAMSEMELFDSDHRRPTEEIAAKALGPDSDSNSIKITMVELKMLQMIGTKTGRGGGGWLTEIGRARAAKLRRP